MASYKDIQASLLQRIKSGEWRPGVLLPAEADLATEFGSTRVTVNRAMQALADAGYVERRRKAGTRVVQRTVREALVRIPVVRQEIERRGERYHYLLLKRTGTRPPATIAAAAKMATRCAVRSPPCLLAHPRAPSASKPSGSMDVVPHQPRALPALCGA